MAAFNVYRAQHGPLEMDGTNAQYRYLAYRTFVSWCWGFLGKNIRVTLPSCLVCRIRREFPEDEGQYTGFRPPLNG